MDNTIILIGAQGAGKGTFFRALAMDESFYADVSIKPSGQVGSEIVEGKWIIELGELSSVTNPEKLDELKQYMTRRAEHYRKPYMRRVEDYPRHNIFIGSCNRGEFLTDDTGNRRWWPIKVNSIKTELDDRAEELRNDVEQCWAEMLDAYKNNLPLANPCERSEILTLANIEREKASIRDDDIGVIQSYLSRHQEIKKICCKQIWTDALHPGAFCPDMTRKDSLRIGSILTNSLHWESGETINFGAPLGNQRPFYRPKDDTLTGEPLPWDDE